MRAAMRFLVVLLVLVLLVAAVLGAGASLGASAVRGAAEGRELVPRLRPANLRVAPPLSYDKIKALGSAQL